MRNLLFLLLTGLLFACASDTLKTSQYLEDLPSYNPVCTTPDYAYNSVIRLNNPQRNFYCTGIVIDNNYALTASHCVKNFAGNLSSDDILISNNYGMSTGIVAKAVALESLRDVAFIKGDFSRFEHSKVDFEGSNVKTGMNMKSCGYPSGQGYMYCVDLKLTGNKYFQYRTKGGPIFKGMSGGPVYDSNSVLIGVNSAVDEEDVIISPLVGILELLGLK